MIDFPARNISPRRSRWIRLAILMGLFCSIANSLHEAYAEKIADERSTCVVVDAIIRGFNADDFDSIFAIGTETWQNEQSLESQSGFLSQQIKPFGKITSRELVEDLGEMKYYRLDFDDGTRRRSLLMNIGVDATNRYYALGFRNMPKQHPPRDAEVRSDNALESDLDRSVDVAATRYMQDPAMVGVSIGIVANGNFHVYNYGETKVGNGILPSADSFFELGSITKTFTGILLAQAVLDKKVDLDDDIRKYLGAGYPNLEFEGSPIQLRHLATHSSGLPSITDNLDGSESNVDPWADFSQEKLLDGLHRVSLQFKPGSAFAYSNIGFGILGLVLEKVYETSYADLVKRHIGEPAGMKETKIELTELETPRFVTGHTNKGKPTPYWHVRGAESAGALRSTVNDMLLYMKWNIERAHPAVRLSHDVHWTGTGSRIGLGWGVMQTALGSLNLKHDGGTGGFRTSCSVYPDMGIGIIVLTNNGNSAANLLANEIFFRMTKPYHAASPVDQQH